MDRRSFIASTGAFALALGGGPSQAASFTAAETTNETALTSGPGRPNAGRWVRLVMGAGVAYQKQIGLGREAGPDGELFFAETQIGVPGGTCNPNTMRRVYLVRPHLASLFAQDAVLANVANSGTILTRWGDVGGGQTQTPADATLRLLDAPYLYDDRPLRVVSRVRESLWVAAVMPYAGSSADARGPLRATAVTHVVAEFAPPETGRHELTRLELWTTPAVPFGVAKLRAMRGEREPFEMRVHSHGTGFTSDLAMSLETVRAITPDGTHVQTR